MIAYKEIVFLLQYSPNMIDAHSQKYFSCLKLIDKHNHLNYPYLYLCKKKGKNKNINIYIYIYLLLRNSLESVNVSMHMIPYEWNQKQDSQQGKDNTQWVSLSQEWQQLHQSYCLKRQVDLISLFLLWLTF